MRRKLSHSNHISAAWNASTHSTKTHFSGHPLLKTRGQVRKVLTWMRWLSLSTMTILFLVSQQTLDGRSNCPGRLPAVPKLNKKTPFEEKTSMRLLERFAIWQRKSGLFKIWCNLEIGDCFVETPVMNWIHIPRWKMLPFRKKHTNLNKEKCNTKRNTYQCLFRGQRWILKTRNH